MFEHKKTYTAEQVETAARELREAAGSDVAPADEAPVVVPDGLTASDAIAMMQSEIRLLRERGFTDERIADLLVGFDIDVTADDIGRQSIVTL